MKTWRVASVLIGLLFVAGPAWAGADEEKEHGGPQAAIAVAKVSIVQAIETAMKEVKDGKPFEAELEMEEGNPQYDVKVMVGDECFEVEIDAVTGKVLEVEKKERKEGQRWTFDTEQVGKTPEGLLIKQNNPTTALGKWTVEADPAAPSKPNVLSLKTENGNATFNLAIIEKVKAKDVDVSVKLRGNTGEEDQGGGLMWRVKDENNYYVCRINPLENNYRVYKVVDGKRKQIQSANCETPTGKWFTVRAAMVGDQITCYVDGKKLLDVKDETFKEAGMIGLWTKADASSSFDDLVVRAPKGKQEHEKKAAQ